MAQRFILILLLPVLVYGQCPPPYVPVAGNCLFFETIGLVTHYEARQLCFSADGKLAAILTPTYHKAVVDYINANGLSGRHFWLDGSDEENEGIWLTSNGAELPMGTPFWEADPNRQQPDNGRDQQHCLTLDSNYNYYMDDDNCTSEFNAIYPTGIKPNKSIDCPTFYVDVGGKCLSFMTWADETWDSARQACVGLQGELATIDDVDLLREVYLYLHQVGLSSNSFWLGGSDASEEGTWQWLDGSPVPMERPSGVWQRPPEEHKNQMVEHRKTAYLFWPKDTTIYETWTVKMC